MNMFIVSITVICSIVAVWMIAWLVDAAVPEPPASDSYYPRVGDVLHSTSEGFTSKVVATDKNQTWLQLRAQPHAAGPPAHVHTTFSETFLVSKGVLSLRVGDEVKVLRPGEEFTVFPGIIHKPFNETDEDVIVVGPITPKYGLPRDFALFLAQVYGYMDESPRNAKLARLLLQMSLFSSRYDTWIAGPPLWVQRLVYAVLRPVARMMGHRSYYERFTPNAWIAAGNRNIESTQVSRLQ